MKVEGVRAFRFKGVEDFWQLFVGDDGADEVDGLGGVASGTRLDREGSMGSSRGNRATDLVWIPAEGGDHHQLELAEEVVERLRTGEDEDAGVHQRVDHRLDVARFEILKGEAKDTGDSGGDHGDGPHGLQQFHREPGADDIFVAGGAAEAKCHGFGQAGENPSEEDQDESLFLRVGELELWKQRHRSDHGPDGGCSANGKGSTDAPGGEEKQQCLNDSVKDQEEVIVLEVIADRCGNAFETGEDDFGRKDEILQGCGVQQARGNGAKPLEHRVAGVDPIVESHAAELSHEAGAS